MLTLQKKAKITKCKPITFDWSLSYTHIRMYIFRLKYLCLISMVDRFAFSQHIFEAQFLVSLFFCYPSHSLIRDIVLGIDSVRRSVRFVSFRLFNEQRWKQKANKKWKTERQKWSEEKKTIECVRSVLALCTNE